MNLRRGVGRLDIQLRLSTNRLLHFELVHGKLLQVLIELPLFALFHLLKRHNGLPSLIELVQELVVECEPVVQVDGVESSVWVVVVVARFVVGLEAFS